MDTVLTHKWQEQGLGTAPFRAVCIISLPSAEMAEKNPSGYANALADASQSAQGYGVMLGTCYSCGQGLMNNVVIRDAAGHHFIVGIDCAGKTHDTKLISRVEYLEKQRQKAIREARREAEWQERQAKREAELAAQRERNGGLTDAEVEAQKRAEAEAQREAAMTAKNGWLLDVLARVPYESGFVSSIMADLETRTVASLSDRCKTILAEIYAKTASGARKGSKTYLAAEEEFWARVGE